MSSIITTVDSSIEAPTTLLLQLLLDHCAVLTMSTLEFVACKLPKIYIWIVVLGMTFYLLTNSVKFPAKKLDWGSFYEYVTVCPQTVCPETVCPQKICPQDSSSPNQFVPRQFVPSDNSSPNQFVPETVCPQNSLSPGTNFWGQTVTGDKLSRGQTVLGTNCPGDKFFGDKLSQDKLSRDKLLCIRFCVTPFLCFID